MNLKNKKLSRRGFLKGSAAAAGLCFGIPTIVPAHVLGVEAPSNKITVACIGLGGQGLYNLRGFLHRDDTRIIAVCDCDKTHLRQGLETAKLNADAGYTDFRQVLARSDIDVVVNCTPDHWHVPISIAAAKAGKDIYCEKPLTLTIAEGRRLVKAVRQYGRILQNGSQQRSDARFHQAAELIRNGRIGRLKQVFVEIPANNRPNPTQWQLEPVPEEFDYELWLGPAPWAPYTRQRCHYSFRFISDYSGGQMTNWGAHHLDIVQWALGMDGSGPVRIEGEGKIPQNGLFDTADNVRIQYTYADGVRVQCRTSDVGSGRIRFEGSEGWLEVAREYLKVSDTALLRDPLGPDDIRLYSSRDHGRDFLNCVKSRREPIADVEIGHRSATVCHLGNIAIKLARPLRWNPEAEQFMDDESADRMLNRTARSPWYFM
jgi:predicted dehydrogenase